MKNINIKELEFTLSLPTILNAMTTNSSIAIDIEGKVYINEAIDTTLPIIFSCESFESHSNIMDGNVHIKQLFKEYRPVVNGAVFTIKPLIAWQQIIDLNKDRMLYFDHQSDGVELFEDKLLEDMGWEATALDITYREITEHIEKSCDGFLIYYDNDIQFNGFVIVEDIKVVQNSVQSFIEEKIKIKIEEGDLDIDDVDVQEALEFFKVEV